MTVRPCLAWPASYNKPEFEGILISRMRSVSCFLPPSFWCSGEVALPFGLAVSPGLSPQACLRLIMLVIFASSFFFVCLFFVFCSYFLWRLVSGNG